MSVWEEGPSLIPISSSSSPWFKTSITIATLYSSAFLCRSSPPTKGMQGLQRPQRLGPQVLRPLTIGSWICLYVES